MQAPFADRTTRPGADPAPVAAPPKVASLSHRQRVRRLALASLACAVPGLALVGAQPAAAEPSPVVCAVTDGTPLGPATGWTEFVRGNGQRGAESEGSIAYGGNLTAQGMTVGTRLTSGRDEPTLVVAGTAHSFNLQKGSAYVRNLTGYINFNGSGKRLADPPFDVAAAFPALRDLSALWAQEPANGSADVVESGTHDTVAMGGPVLLLRGTDPQRNTFSVTPQQLTGIRATLVDVPAGSTVLINVSGSDVQVNGEVRFRVGGTYQQPDNTPVRDAVQRTIWNFGSATAVRLNTHAAFGGTVFAPDAAVSALTIGHSNGQTIAASFSSNFETHQYLIASDACLPGGTPPTPDPEPEPDPEPLPAELHVAKSVDRPTVLGGEQATFTLTVTNHGAGPANDVVLSDLLPAGTTFASADAGCTATGQVVRCVAGRIAPGASASFRISVVTAPVHGVAGGGNDQLSAVSVEQYLTLTADEVQTARVRCADGGVLTDSSVEVLQVDQGTGTLEDVEILRLHTRDGAYEAVVANHATGMAQARVYGVCLPARTTDGHALLVGDPVEKTVTLGVGRHHATFECGAGRTPIAPSLNVARGRATVVASVPVGDSGRRITVDVSAPDTEVTVGVRCLSALTGASNGTTTALRWNTISAAVTVGPGQTITPKLICGDQQKGIVAGWELEGGLTPLGHAPQPKARVFRFHNPTAATKTGTIYLLCVDERTADPQGTTTVTNTVTGTTSSAQSGGAVLSAGADLTIQAATPPSDPPSVDVTPDAPLAPYLVASPLPTPTPTARLVGPAVATATSARLRSSTVSVGVRCRNARCRGTVEVRADRKLRVGGRTVKARGLLAKRTFRVTRGRTGAVRVTLPKRIGAALRRQGVKTVRITVRDASGRSTTKRLRLRR